MSVELFEARRFELLWEQFSRSLDKPLASPMAIETIVIPASGWESYFSRQLASQRGCWARYRFQTLGQWINTTCRRMLGEEQFTPRDPEALTWAIARALPSLLDRQEFVAVRNYLGADGQAHDVRRRLELSRCLAGLFDQYLLNRPELITAWEAGQDWPGGPTTAPPDAIWQRVLWQAVRQTMPIQSVATLVDRVAAVLAEQTIRLPQRVSVWICGSVPPAHLRFLDAVGRQMAVSIYLLVPRAASSPPESSHPLWQSWGELARQRQSLVADFLQAGWQRRLLEDVAADRPPTTLLERLQAGISNSALSDEPLGAADASLRVHSCYSAIRELEVLREQLRDALEADPSLRPEDLVILSPDIEAYAPLVRAVFGLTEANQPGHIPFRISGRSPRQVQPVAEAYFRLLETFQGRFSASEVLDLLAIDVIRDAADLTPDELEDLVSWIEDSRVCWGADAEHRRQEQLPDSDLNTWQFGLDRLFMGYAMPPGGGQLVGSIVALDRAEGQSAQTLGKFWKWFDELRGWRTKIRTERILTDWREPLFQLIERFLKTQDEIGLQKIRNAVDQLINLSVEQGFHEKMTFALVTHELAHVVDQSPAGAAFQLGGVTVCEITAMRSLPFKVIAMLGLNDGVFPRMDRPVGFDLIGAQPLRPGDRSLRLEDKHLMLEALLSARARLIITYQGQNAQDQRQRPPSVAVEELLDVIEQTCCQQAGRPEGLRDELLVRHPLQAFSVRYFEGRDARLFSYDVKQLHAAQALRKQPTAPPQFAPEPLADLSELREVRVTDLRKLIECPWELFLRRLGIRLTEFDEPTTEREPLLLGPLEQWSIGNQWLQQRLINDNEEMLTETLRRSGQVPHAALGTVVLEKVKLEAAPIVMDALAQCGGLQAQSRPIRLKLDDMLIVGRVEGVTPQGLRQVMYSKLSDKYYLRLWLDQLLVTAASGESLGAAILIARDSGMVAAHGMLQTVEPDFARFQLSALLRLYRAALCVPLPFFPDSLSAATKKFRPKGNPPMNLDYPANVQTLLNVAEQAYRRQFNGTSTAELPSVRQAFAGRDPFEMRLSDVPGMEAETDESVFVHLFKIICVPMLEHRPEN